MMKSSNEFYSCTDMLTSRVLAISAGFISGDMQCYLLDQPSLILPRDAIVIKKSRCGDAMLFTDEKWYVYQYHDGKMLHMAAFTTHVEDRILFCVKAIDAVEKRAFEPDSDVVIPSIKGLKR